MAEVGTASMTIVPRFDNLSASVKKAISQADTTGAGRQLGDGVERGFKGSGIAKTGAIAGVFAAATTAAMSAITSHVADATSRLDTLKNYPRAMQTLGFSAKQTDESIAKMDDHLQGLPTALNAMSSTVQGLSVITRDIDRATDLGLGINDMLLAGGQSQQIVSAAAEQFRQILAKGKPEMQDWKSIMQAAPGQLDQVARAMLGTGATAQDLYAYLGGGSKDAADPAHLQEFIDTIIRLDKEGGAGIVSFEQQARTATGGVQTSVANLHTAITRGIANVMDAVGTDTIADATAGTKEIIDGLFGGMAGAARVAVPAIKDVVSAVKEMAPVIVTAMGAFAADSAVGKVIDTVSSKMARLSATWSSASRIGTGLSEVALNVAAGMSEGSKGQERMLGIASRLGTLTKGPVVAGLTLTATAVAGVAYACYSAYEHERKLDVAVRSLSEATSDTASLVGYSGTLDGVGASASASAMSAGQLAESMSSHAEKMKQNTAEAEKNLATLNTAQNIINEYAGRTNLAADEQGRLQWALQQVNDEFGLSISAADVMANSYTDASGAAVTLTDSINELIEKKKDEIKLDAMSSNLSEAYAAESDALVSYEAAVKRAAAAKADLDAASGSDREAEFAQKYRDANREVEETSRLLGEAKDKSSALEAQFGLAIVSQSDAAKQMADTIRSLGDAGIENVDYLAAKLVEAGVSTQTMAEMGAAGFSTLAASCDGNVNAMLIALTSVDSFVIGDKTFAVTDDGSVYLGEQRLGDLNSFQIGDKRYWVDDSGSIATEEGKVATLHGQVTQLPDGKYTITGTEDGTASRVASRIADFAGKTFSYFINGIAPKATGGLAMSLHAAGIQRLRLDGPGTYVTNGPTDIGTDRYGIMHIAGEDGTEIIQRHADGTTSVFPIENRQYMNPLANTVAEMIGAAGGTTIINNNNITVNASNASDGYKLGRELDRYLKMQRMKEGSR